MAIERFKGDTLVGTLDVVIANGASLSGAVDLGGCRLFAIEMPSSWTAANLTFQACSTEGGTYKDVYDDAGTEVTVTAAASRVIGLDAVASELAALRHIKFRSGTSAAAVNQGAERTIKLILKG